MAGQSTSSPTRRTTRIVFDDRPFHSPGRFYPYSFLIQTYSKSALAPGQRLGYVALPPTMPDRERIRRALPEIETLSIDIGHLQRKRDRLVAAFGRDVLLRSRARLESETVQNRQWRFPDACRFARERQRRCSICRPDCVGKWRTGWNWNPLGNDRQSR